MIEKKEEKEKVADIRRISGKSHESYELEDPYLGMTVLNEAQLEGLGLVVDKDSAELYEKYYELYCSSCKNKPTYDRKKDEWYCPACR